MELSTNYIVLQVKTRRMNKRQRKTIKWLPTYVLTIDCSVAPVIANIDGKYIRVFQKWLRPLERPQFREFEGPTLVFTKYQVPLIGNCHIKFEKFEKTWVHYHLIETP